MIALIVIGSIVGIGVYTFACALFINIAIDVYNKRKMG